VRRRLDLVLVVALTAAVVVAVLAVPDLRIARAVLGIPFVCGATGYALLAATSHAPDRGGWLAMLVPALSLVVAMLVALALSLAGIALTTTALTLALAAWTLAACAVAALRRRDHPGAALSVPAVLFTGWPPAVAAAVAVFVLALMALHGPLRDDHVAGYAELWAVPEQVGANVRIGVVNVEPRAAAYRVEVDTGGKRRDSHRISLAPGQRWTQLLVGSRRGKRPQVLKVRLYRLAQPDVVYRQVVLRA
jgi:uncharacterized membrane protein